MSAVGERLREAVEEHDGMSIRQFQKRMDETDVDGTSYSAVHRYLRPGSTTEPSIAFLKEAAEVLGVRPEWLILNRGKREKIGEALPSEDWDSLEDVPDPGEGVETAEEQSSGGRDTLRERIREEYPRLWSALPKSVRPQFLRTFSRYVLVAEDGGEVPRDEEDMGRLVDLAGYLLWLLSTPTRAFNFEGRHSELGAEAMLHALKHYLPERRSGRPLSDFRNSPEFARWQRALGAYEERREAAFS